MPDIKKTLLREFKVAFSLKTQPLYFRVAKWLIIMAVVFLLRRVIHPALLLGILTTAGLMLHFYIRFKTDGWKKSYGGWKYDEVFGKAEEHT